MRPVQTGTLVQGAALSLTVLLGSVSRIEPGPEPVQYAQPVPAIVYTCCTPVMTCRLYSGMLRGQPCVCVTAHGPIGGAAC
jgi:hypothetical protein